MAPQPVGDGIAPAFPNGFTEVQAVLNGAGNAKEHNMVNVLGVIRDLQPPIKTKRNEFKSTISFFDKSTEEEGGTMLKINIFRPEEDMPKISAGDVILIYTAKIQNWGGPSLITNWSTTMYIYSASLIPKPPGTAAPAISGPIGTASRARTPTREEHAYVSWLYHNVDKFLIPEPEEFKMQVNQCVNINDKFKLFKDLRDSMFCNAIVQVVKPAYTMGDLATFWVSDYTSNDAFKRFSYEPEGNGEPSDGDPYGYIDSPQEEWLGPYGQRSMQITAWGVHAEAVDSAARQGAWLKLRNLQVKFGRDGLYLEGFLRESRNDYGPKLMVEVLKTDGDYIEDKLKEAVRRKLAYEKSKKKQLQNQAAGASSQVQSAKKKSAHEQPERENRKTKRQKLHAEVQRKEMEKAEAEKKDLEKKRQEDEKSPKKTEESFRLNRSIKCESTDRPATRLSTILELISRDVELDGEKIAVTLPFINSKHRVIVRVVDFAPRNLQDFARWRQKTEYDILSEHSGADSDFEEDICKGTLASYRGEKKWEWRFALQLEEANPEEQAEEPSRVWALVDNIEGQLLTNLDACDLRAEEEQLHRLREQLFKLWGNLEEIKAEEAQNNVARRKRIDAHKPPESSPLVGPIGVGEVQAKAAKLSNTAFTCCIHQYGVKVPEEDPERADAGPERRWERLFGIFGTKIASCIPE